jgi:hypothetical protein
MGYKAKKKRAQRKAEKEAALAAERAQAQATDTVA